MKMNSIRVGEAWSSLSNVSGGIEPTFDFVPRFSHTLSEEGSRYRDAFTPFINENEAELWLKTQMKENEDMKTKKLTKENIEMNVVEKVANEDTFVDITSPNNNAITIDFDYMKLIFSRMNETAIIPSKDDANAGYDLYANYPEGTDNIQIKPHTSVLVPTGVRVAIPTGYVGLLEERGSTGIVNLKKNAGVIDSNYRGEIFVCLFNGNNTAIVLSRNIEKVEEYMGTVYYPMSKAIAQMMIVPVPRFSTVEYTAEEFNKLTTNRGNGKLGSSGK